MLPEIFLPFQVLLPVVLGMVVFGFSMTLLSSVAAPFMERGPQAQSRTLGANHESLSTQTFIFYVQLQEHGPVSMGHCIAF